MINEFIINVADEQISDLHNRIKHTRWPDEINDSRKAKNKTNIHAYSALAFK